MDPNKLNQFKNEVVSGNLTTIKNAKKFRKKFDDVCDDMVNRYTKEYENTLKIFEDYKKTKEYNNLTSGIESQMYPKGKERIFTFITIDGTDVQKNDLKNIYGTTNEGDKKIFTKKRKLN
jgi:hypothetical protein